MDTQTLSFTYRMQFDYLCDTTLRLLEFAAQLPSDAYLARDGYSQQSLHNTFVHLIGAGKFWRNIITEEPVVDLEPEQVAGIDAVRALVSEERQAWQSFWESHNDTALLASIERQTPWGVSKFIVWKTLQHVILHGMQHLAEVCRLLTNAGQSPGDIDFLSYGEAWGVQGS
jgi:uncharacterized damage-inducible protein DinB